MPPNTPPTASSVFSSLSQSRAQLLHRRPLGSGLELALWRNQHDSTQYERPEHHTLSCYLAGGWQTYRRDQPSLRGAPGKLCLLPAEHHSAWVVNGPLEFAHLYISPERLTRDSLWLLDREPREIQLSAATFYEDQQLSHDCRLLALASPNNADSLLCTSVSQRIVDRLLTHHSQRSVREYRGGLSPHVRNRLREFIEAHLEQSLTLDDLARVANLSPYHFNRMFRHSFGQTPHAWVMQRRTQRAFSLLQRSTQDIEQVASQCGFADARHLRRHLRQHYQLTAQQIRGGL